MPALSKRPKTGDVSERRTSIAMLNELYVEKAFHRRLAFLLSVCVFQACCTAHAFKTSLVFLAHRVLHLANNA